MRYDFLTHLKTSFCINALEMAIHNRQFPSQILMHYSNREIQYCSYSYQLLLANNIAISITQNDDYLENALVERMNVFFKHNFDLTGIFQNYEEAKQPLFKASINK